MLFDDVALLRDPNLTQPVVGKDVFKVNPGSLRPTYETPNGQKLEQLLTSRYAVSALVGAICAAPTKPPTPAVELLLETELGEEAFTNAMKQLTGRIIRQIVEYLDGRHVSYGVPVTVTSRFRKGSVYEFPYFERKPRNKTISVHARRGERGQVWQYRDGDRLVTERRG